MSNIVLFSAVIQAAKDMAIAEQSGDIEKMKAALEVQKLYFDLLKQPNTVIQYQNPVQPLKVPSPEEHTENVRQLLED